MPIEVRPAVYEEKAILRHLLHLYLYELSQFTQCDVDAQGLYEYRYLDHYWTEAERHPFLLQIEGQWAGFCLLRVQEDGKRSVSEFFVARKYRREGVGSRMARLIFDLFPGRWEISQLPDHIESHLFWRQVIGQYTEGDYREETLDLGAWQQPVQYFDNSLRGSRA